MARRAVPSRRKLFLLATALGVSLIFLSCTPLDHLWGPTAFASKTSEKAEVKANLEEVLPVEDLMREHGVLRRILLIYNEAANLLETDQQLDPTVIDDAAGIVQRFIEEYHEKLEEQYLFPNFQKAGKLTDLTRVLLAQHQAGRRITTGIRDLAKTPFNKPEDRPALARALRQFVRMYEPHAAREDTVLFPAFRSVITPEEYAKFGDVFEDKEKELFGEKGFENVVDQAASIEKRLGILDLAQFTPRY